MPHVIGIRVSQRRSDPTPGFPQSKGDVIVLATPANKTLVEAVDRFEVATRNADVATRELWFRVVADQLVILFLDLFLEHSPAFVPRHPRSIGAGSDRRGVDPFSGLSIEPQAIAGTDDIRRPGMQVLEQVIGRKQAVAVREKEIRCAACAHAVVSAQRDAETIVRMRDPRQWITARAGEPANEAVRAVLRAVVGDDYLELASNALLQLERNQRPFKVFRSFVSREDDGDFYRSGHASRRIRAGAALA